MTEKKTSGRQPFQGPGPDHPDNAAFRAVGKALFGPTWQTAMAEALGDAMPGTAPFNVSTVRSWALGRRAVSPWAWPALDVIAMNRRNAVEQAERTIRRKAEEAGSEGYAGFMERRELRQPLFQAIEKED